jgi:hypothetical protein
MVWPLRPEFKCVPILVEKPGYGFLKDKKLWRQKGLPGMGTGVSSGKVIVNLARKRVNGQALVAYACNPSYSGVRDQEDRGSKPARANSSPDPISRNPSQK